MSARNAATSMVVLAMALAACAGPKMMSTALGGHEIWTPPGQEGTIAIRPLTVPRASDSDDDLAKDLALTAHLVDALAKKLHEGRHYAAVATIGPDEAADASLLLEVAIIGVTRAGWGSRAVGFGGNSTATVVGRLIDRDQDRVLVTFRKSRSGQGGLLGVGGLLSAGEEDLARKHVEWVVDDIVKVVTPARN